MKDWKKVCRRLLFLPVWLIIILVIVSAAALVTVFAKDRNKTVIAYMVYVIAFYTLTVLCLACWKTIPSKYKKVKSEIYNNKYANKYLTDVEFKTHINLYRSLAINLVYAVFNAVSGIIYRSHWFGIFAIYYGIMAVMRFLLVRYVGKNHIGTSRLGELKRSRICAYILMTVNLVLSGVVIMMIYFNKGFHYKGILIYVMAMYTFYITVAAVVDIVKFRKYNSPVMSIEKVIKLAAALFSMLFLETAMFSQFGGDTSQKLQQLMIMATGAGISIIVVTMSVFVIVRTTKEVKKLKK